ncbi:Blue copper protein [Rhynchospora pubera]|uniref:Blue copper protein n=1 Tax=Rhynchospora pubera TaxID=906938 RepID=A0AAV8BVK1_9POAL|nr:Blue copper protein [Rhynchospora pubera]
MDNLLILSVVAILGTLLSAEGAVYTVGNSAGWDISADFPSWVRNQTFYVGDVLVFQYNKYHTVNEVDKSGYDNCSTDNTLLTDSTGNTTVPLTAPGNRYFICGVLTHCLGGMKLAVTVERNRTLSPIGAPVGAPLSPFDPQSATSPASAITDGNNLPSFVSRSSEFGKGYGVLSWLFTLGTLLMVLAVKL